MTATATAPATDVVTLNVEAAESLTTDIRTLGVATVEARKAFAAKVAYAYKTNVAEALGFASWSAYAADVFSADAFKTSKLSKSDREGLVSMMIETAGIDAVSSISTRALASMLGCSTGTASYLRKALGLNVGETIGRDGKIYTVKPAEPAADPEESEESEEGKPAAESKPKGKGKGKSSGKGKSAAFAVETAKTNDLLGLAENITRELSKRWQDGDESAESALRDLYAAIGALVD